MDLVDNRKKRGRKKGSRKGSRKSSRKGKAAAKTSRSGLTSRYLPFRAKTYGKNLPEWAKDLGWTGDTIPVVSALDKRSDGIYALEFSGMPLNKPKGPERPKVEKLKRLMAQAKKIADQYKKALAGGASAAKLKELGEKWRAKQDEVISEELLEIIYQAQLAAMTPAGIRKLAKARHAELLALAGLTPTQAPQSTQVVSAATRARQTPLRAPSPQLGAEAFRRAKATPGYGSMTRAEQARVYAAKVTELVNAQKARRQAQGAVTPNGYGVFMPNADMFDNPEEVYGFAAKRSGKKKKRKRVILDLEPAKRGDEGAVTVVVGPQAYRYAKLVKKEMKKNGFHSVRKNMSKKRRMHSNPLGSDLMALGQPVLAATAGFAASRAVNALALWGLEKAKVNTAGNAAQIGARLAATGAGIAATLTVGDRVEMIRNNRNSIVVGMALNAIEGVVRRLVKDSVPADGYMANLALGGSYYDMSHAGAPYAPMMGEYVAQSLNGGFGEYVAQSLNGGMGEYVAQSLNGGMGSYVAQAAAGVGEYVAQSLNGGDGLGEYVAQSLNGFGEYSEGVDPSDQESVDGMISGAEAVAGLGTEVMAATAGLGTEVMAATAGLGSAQGMNRGIVTRKGIYNFFTQPVAPSGGRIPAVSIEDAPMPVTNMGGARPGAVPIGDQVATPEGRGYAGGIFSRHLFGAMT